VRPLFGIRQILFHIPSLEHLNVKETQSANVQDDGIDRQLSVPEQVGLIAPEIIRSDGLQGVEMCC
jgi:hypothetical protein